MSPNGSDFPTDMMSLRFAAVMRRRQAQSGAIREARQNAQMTQVELARATGMTLGTIQRAECGSRAVSVTTFGRIARATGVRLEVLLALALAFSDGMM